MSERGWSAQALSLVELKRLGSRLFFMTAQKHLAQVTCYKKNHKSRVLHDLRELALPENPFSDLFRKVPSYIGLQFSYRRTGTLFDCCAEFCYPSRLVSQMGETKIIEIHFSTLNMCGGITKPLEEREEVWADVRNMLVTCDKNERIVMLADFNGWVYTGMHMRESQKKNESRTNAVEMRFPRNTCGVSMKDRCSNSDVRERDAFQKDVIKVQKDMSQLFWPFGKDEFLSTTKLQRGRKCSKRFRKKDGSAVHCLFSFARVYHSQGVAVPPRACWKRVGSCYCVWLQ
ncbi:hypothetical protein EVAR_45962_1 [Eumeta japonica]|uniref:Endonuclease/exonuclease/phosphatase domain-containing protein n=1 Tax=Eumeta variegata TaxID=151549 RepID=A0A4C1YQ84_EUMVA|nr:hypothetical protein EVAR_45962_1 [Eumeta japonica]